MSSSKGFGFVHKTEKQKLIEKYKKLYAPKNVNLEVVGFEKYIYQDILYSDDDRIKIRLNRNLTEEFKEFIVSKIKKKENISINIMGETRSGKSLASLRISKLIVDTYNELGYKKEFNTDFIVCANQKEYRLNLQKAEFGDVFQIDENVFASAGDGSALEQAQLKDIQNIIAKKNIHTLYLTPNKFLPTGARIGLRFFSKDVNNWLSKFLVYYISGVPELIGYVVIDINSLFIDYGCYIYREIGGCNNNERLNLYEISQEKIQDSFCIPKNYKKSDLNDKVCPFYNICKHPLCSYEHKKDSWIEREIKGGMDERQKERFRIALEVFKKLAVFKEDRILLKVRSGKELAMKLDLYVSEITNTKLSITEKGLVAEAVKSLTDIEFLESVCKTLEVNFEEIINKLKNTE